MPRRELLTPAQRQHLLALPSSARHIAECYTLSAADLELVSIHRGEQNRLGFALQLCFLRHPGRAWTPEEQVPSPMVRFIRGFGVILRESLVIGGWVAMWRPLEVFLYDWWPILSEAKLYDRLAAMPVRIQYAAG